MSPGPPEPTDPPGKTGSPPSAETPSQRWPRSKKAPSLRVDLHSHSNYSDGEYDPTVVAAMAAEADLKALALTDHDCVDGLDEFAAAAVGLRIGQGMRFARGLGGHGYLLKKPYVRFVS